MLTTMEVLGTLAGVVVVVLAVLWVWGRLGPTDEP